MKETRYFKVKSYVGAIVPNQGSGHFSIKICYPSKNKQLDCRSGELALFGIYTEPKIHSVPITAEHFRYAKTLISNDDSQNIKVDLILLTQNKSTSLF